MGLILMDFGTIIQRMLRPLSIRVKNIVSRAVVDIVDDSLKLQGLQIKVQADSVRKGVERFQEYGFTSVPAKDAEAVLLQVGGVASHLVVIAVDDRSCRPKGLEEGEVAIYTKANGILAFFDKDGIINLGAKAASDAVALASLVKARLDSIQSTFDSHIHTTTATIGPSAAVGVISPPTSPIGSLADVASEKVLSE
jgi:phage baseplate assembly protein V